MPVCDNCHAKVPELHKTSWGQRICCPHCAFSPLGCRCKYGEFGMAETYQDDFYPTSAYDEDGEPDYTLDELEWQETCPELCD